MNSLLLISALVVRIGVVVSLNCLTSELKTDKTVSAFIICNDTNIRSYGESREFCQKKFKGSDLVVFQNKAEYDYLRAQLQDYHDTRLEFLPGFYQQQSDDRWRPQTGDFYWTNSNERLTNKSKTYWQPFSLWITNFSSIQPPSERQFAYYLMDSHGVVSPGIRFNGGILSAEKNDPYIICMIRSENDKGTDTSLPVASTTDQINEQQRHGTTPLIYVVVAYFVAAPICCAFCIIGSTTRSMCLMSRQQSDSGERDTFHLMEAGKFQSLLDDIDEV